MQKGGGQLGMAKHRTMGDSGPNRRGLQRLAEEVNRKLDDTKEKKKSHKVKMYRSVRELMRNERKRK